MLRHGLGLGNNASQDWLLYVLVGASSVVASTALLRELKSYFGDSILWNQPYNQDKVSRKDHDRRRNATYPDPVCNTWYL